MTVDRHIESDHASDIGQTLPHHRVVTVWIDGMDGDSPSATARVRSWVSRAAADAANRPVEERDVAVADLTLTDGQWTAITAAVTAALTAPTGL